MGLIHGASGPKVHGSSATPTHYSQLFWRRGWQFHSQWQRRYVDLFIHLPLLSHPHRLSRMGAMRHRWECVYMASRPYYPPRCPDRPREWQRKLRQVEPQKHADVCVLLRRLHHTLVGTFAERGRHRVDLAH